MKQKKQGKKGAKKTQIQKFVGKVFKENKKEFIKLSNE